MKFRGIVQIGKYMINLLISFRKKRMAGKLFLAPSIANTHTSEILTCGTKKKKKGSQNAGNMVKCVLIQDPQALKSALQQNQLREQINFIHE